MNVQKRLHKLRSGQPRTTVTVTVLSIIAIVSIGAGLGVKYFSYLVTQRAQQHYFMQLPAEVKTAYIPQLSQIDSPAPAGLWQTACYQRLSNGSSSSSSPITCGVWAGELVGSSLTLAQARIQFQKLTSVVTSQGFSDIKTVYNYTPNSDSSVVDIHFSATGHDKNCTVVADYGSASHLSQFVTNSQMLDSVGNKDISAIFYYMQCSQKLTKSINSPGSNIYVFPGTTGGYPLTQAQYGYPYGAAHSDPDPFTTTSK